MPENEDRPVEVRDSFNVMTSLLMVVNHTPENDLYNVLARYLLEHFNDLQDMSIYTVADDCFASRSSVQRFIKSIGYESFTSMKANAKVVKAEAAAFLTYTSQPDYEHSLQKSVDDMMQDINSEAELQDIDAIGRMISQAKNTVIVVSETSNNFARTFQESMVSLGKLIRIQSDSMTDQPLIHDLDEDDLILVASVSGNYALRLNNEMKEIRTGKVLITLNRAELFKQVYNRIFYLSGIHMISRSEPSKMRNVYTKYGMLYFFDLLYHSYVKQMGLLDETKSRSDYLY
jgi:DNA-binding MurR/RpiR family transcriptional regulator